MHDLCQQAFDEFTRSAIPAPRVVRLAASLISKQAVRSSRARHWTSTSTPTGQSTCPFLVLVPD